MPTTEPIAPPPSVWRLAWRQMARDFRAGDSALLVVAVMLAVAALTAVGFFADRIDGGLTRDARQMLGGDAIVASDQPTPPQFAAKAAELGLASAGTTTFPSMGRAADAQGGATRLVTVKAVSAAYPLRGKVRLAGAPEVRSSRWRARLSPARPGQPGDQDTKLAEQHSARCDCRGKDDNIDK